MKNRDALAVALGPTGSPEWLEEAIRDGGGHLVGLDECEAIVWSDARHPDALGDAISEAPNLRWVQLPFAGIENFVDHLDDEYTWTCGKGVYAEPVAEMALALALAGLRNVGQYAAATTWSAPAGRNLLDSRVTILGGGGITESLVRLLQPWNCHITVVRNHAKHMDGVDDVLESDRFADALPGADVVVLALALTPETDGLFGRDEFEMMENHAWIVNVARGRHIITDHLVEALQNRHDRRRRARCHRSRAVAGRAPPLEPAELHHHAARRQHARDGQAVAGEAGDGERASISPGQGTPRSRRRRSRILSTIGAAAETPVDRWP